MTAERPKQRPVDDNPSIVCQTVGALVPYYPICIRGTCRARRDDLGSTLLRYDNIRLHNAGILEIDFAC